MLRFLLVTLLFAAVSAPQAQENTGATLARAIHEASLDPDACFRVRDLNFTKEDLKFYLTDGYLIFARPSGGQRLFAVFSGEVEGGDAEVLLMPPHRSERRSLAQYTGSPNLDEHFRTALFVFSDGTGEELFELASQNGKRSIESGALMADTFSSVTHNIVGGFEMRLVEDVLSPDKASGAFVGAIGGLKLGNFDVVHDPNARDQIIVGQFSIKAGRPNFDTWTSFESRSIRSGRRQLPKPRFDLDEYRIEATIDDNLHLSAVTRARLTPRLASRAVLLSVSGQTRIRSVKIDGRVAPPYVSESLRDSALRGGVNVGNLVITPETLMPGRAYSIEIEHEGDVVHNAGNGVYLVTSRGNWYPRGGTSFANYDLTFRYPKRLTLVAAGEVVDERTEGDQRITHRRTPRPVRVAGFNLGQYEVSRTSRAGVQIEVFANQKIEASLEPEVLQPIITAQTRGMIRREVPGVSIPPPPRPQSRLKTLSDSVASAFDFLRGVFGPPPIRSLTVSPIPGAFGQGFPGLVYMSTLAYLSPEQRPRNMRTHEHDMFFDEILPAHEVAHQWIGNYVVPAGYQDDWLIEALSNYAALLFLEKRHGTRGLEEELTRFAEHLNRKVEDGQTMESMGPVTWGSRLAGGPNEEVWRTVVYEKGSWILHMLRRRMGDERFLALLAQIPQRFGEEPISVGQFQRLAEQIMGAKPGQEPLAGFFETWVYGTGVPELKLVWALKGRTPALKVTGTVTQSGVENDFTAEVPVELHFARGAVQTVWVRTSDEPGEFTADVRQPPVKVTIPYNTGVLARR